MGEARTKRREGFCGRSHPSTNVSKASLSIITGVRTSSPMIRAQVLRRVVRDGSISSGLASKSSLSPNSASSKEIRECIDIRRCHILTFPSPRTVMLYVDDEIVKCEFSSRRGYGDILLDRYTLRR